ncbi:MAG: hypothetical protein V3S69_06115 [Dehalococcoidales bacterium]
MPDYIDARSTPVVDSRGFKLAPQVGVDNMFGQGIQQMMANRRYGQARDDRMAAAQQQQMAEDQRKQEMQLAGMEAELLSTSPENMAATIDQMSESIDNPNVSQHFQNLKKNYAADQEGTMSQIRGRLRGTFPQMIPKATTGKPIVLSPGQVAKDPVTGEEVARGLDRPDEAAKDIRKEVRTRLRSDVGKLSQEANIISTNFEKLSNLTKEISSGNRTAVSQGLVALVKIGDPGSIVKESEMVSALNKADPIAAIGSLLSNKGTREDVIESVLSKVDALDPSRINVNDLMSTANAMISANVPGIQSRYGEALQLGTENLEEAGMKSIFGQQLRKRISDLSTLGMAQEDREAFDWATKNPDDPRSQTILNGLNAR